MLFCYAITVEGKSSADVCCSIEFQLNLYDKVCGYQSISSHKLATTIVICKLPSMSGELMEGPASFASSSKNCLPILESFSFFKSRHQQYEIIGMNRCFVLIIIIDNGI